MERVIVLQSFRNHDVPVWVDLCRESARAWADLRGWSYEFIGDEFLDFAPARLRAACGANVWSLTDICRLEWMKSKLAIDADVAIWVDIDMLVFAPERIDMRLSRSHGFSYELYFSGGAAHHGVNNALMFYRRGAPMLDRYLSLCVDALALAAGEPGRTSLGPDLLRSLNIDAEHVIEGVNILNFDALCHVCGVTEGRIPAYVAGPSRRQFGAANLCLNERHAFHGEQRRDYDMVVEAAARALLKNRGEAAPAASPSSGVRVGRNAPCPCGSGRKYKHCHGAPD